jgi:hypothetical protein
MWVALSNPNTNKQWPMKEETMILEQMTRIYYYLI